jgi:hypothetical protein
LQIEPTTERARPAPKMGNFPNTSPSSQQETS